MDNKEPVEYESPRIVDLGTWAELTQHEPPGDPLNSPHHGSDPHMTSSITH